MTLRSKQFDDIYFSPEDGLAETRYVFLKSNNLPEAWLEKSHFTIAEAGFGTGLNFLATWQLFKQTACPSQRLNFISFEKYPLEADEIRNALQPWQGEFGWSLQRLLKLYPIRTPGFHRLVVDENVTLTLCIGDINETLQALHAPQGVDAWFLDGFAPAKNPAMWSETVFTNMARLSVKGARFATFTAAGAVKRGLEEAGFEVAKQRGFGRKRDMLAGEFSQKNHNQNTKYDAHRIAVIGGGLAGTACAYTLKAKGLDPVIYETAGSLAAGASGNAIGMVNPRFFAHPDFEAQFYATAFSQAVRTLTTLSEEVFWNSCGSLHLVTDDDKDRRFNAIVESGFWPTEDLQLLDKQEASNRAGIPLNHQALYLPGAGTVNPAALCNVYARAVDIRLHCLVQTITQESGKWLVGGEEYDAVILACGAAVTQFETLSWLPVHTVRGQLSLAAASMQSSPLKTNLCFGGYITPAGDGCHAIGSTFQKWLTDTGLRAEDHQDNVARLEEAVPALTGELSPQGGRAALRTSSQDRFPVIGQVPDKQSWTAEEEHVLDGLYVSTGHGSHGIISSLAGAHFLADMISGTPLSQPEPVVNALSPARFLRRMKKRGQL